MVRTLTGPHLITTSPSATTCRMCGRVIIAATVVGLDRHIGTATLNDLGEFAAVLAGLRTYEVHGDLLVPRGVEKLRMPRDRTVPVLADHTCQPIPDGYLDLTHSAVAEALVIRVLGAEFVSVTAQPSF